MRGEEWRGLDTTDRRAPRDFERSDSFSRRDTRFPGGADKFRPRNENRVFQVTLEYIYLDIYISRWFLLSLAGNGRPARVMRF